MDFLKSVFSSRWSFAGLFRFPQLNLSIKLFSINIIAEMFKDPTQWGTTSACCIFISLSVLWKTGNTWKIILNRLPSWSNQEVLYHLSPLLSIQIPLQRPSTASPSPFVSSSSISSLLQGTALYQSFLCVNLPFLIVTSRWLSSSHTALSNASS